MSNTACINSIGCGQKVQNYVLPLDDGSVSVLCLSWFQTEPCMLCGSYTELPAYFLCLKVYTCRARGHTAGLFVPRFQTDK